MQVYFFGITFILLKYAILSLGNSICNYENRKDCPVNVLLILADDLGYGDTSVEPFVGSGVRTPNLERMAKQGTVMSNFHTAASTCTPTRASILTGLYPWRLGIKAVFEYGEKGKSNRDDFLIEVPTVAMAFREANYTTIHSGKWHVGGMRNDDYDMRRLATKPNPRDIGSRRCPHPGPNQQGFEHYVSVLDGPGAMRQNELQIQDQLYSRGCDYLLYNDNKIESKDYNISGYLSYCEVAHAMRMMEDSLNNNKPFYTHVWFHAPHGPWEEIPGYGNLYPDQERPSTKEQIDALQPCSWKKKAGRFCSQSMGNKNSRKKVVDNGLSRFLKYRTMISDMDKNIGLLLDFLAAKGIEQNTLVVFLSDNGPEDDAGTTAGHRMRKRYIYEGGIRVPAIFQWVGTIAEGKQLQIPAVSTDLFPTFLDAAGIKQPGLPLDGMSLLPELTGKTKRKHRHQLQDRVILWHNDYEGPRRTAAWVYDYKLFLNEFEEPFELFDMRNDPFESINLLANYSQQSLKAFAQNSIASNFELNANISIAAFESPERYRTMLHKIFGSSEKAVARVEQRILQLKRQSTQAHTQFGELGLTRRAFISDRESACLHQHLLLTMFKPAWEFAKYGALSYNHYMDTHPGRVYSPSLTSDNRYVRGNIYKKMTPVQAKLQKENLLKNTSCGATLCDCEVKSLRDVQPLHFIKTPSNLHYLNPHRFLNGSMLLQIQYG